MLEGKPETLIKVSVEPTSLKFKRCSNVTEWTNFPEGFQDSVMVTGAPVSWSSGNNIWTRFAIRREPSVQTPDGPLKLTLEAMILPADQTLDGLPAEKKRILMSGSGRSILLWCRDAVWYAPSTRTGLVTTPGIQDRGDNSVLSDAIIRWHQASYLDTTLRGSYSKGEDWQE